MSNSWCTIESDPGVFTELIQHCGAGGVQVEELYALSPEVYAQHEPIRGLIFLFKWRKSDYESDARETLWPDEVPHVFFMKQVIHNACATQALLSVLLNAEGVDVGSMLGNFREMTGGMDPELRGEALGSMEEIRKAHNSFARQDPFVSEEKEAAGDDDEVYHFVAYVPVAGTVYELDGLRPGPIKVGDVPPGSNWMHVVQPELERRIERYATSEIRFNLMAVCDDKLHAAEEGIGRCRARLQALQNRGAEVEAALAVDDGDLGGYEASPADVWTPPQDPAVVRESAASLTRELEEYREQRARELAKRRTWKEENKRRQHNYVPFVVRLMREMAQRTSLPELHREAREAKQKRIQEERAKKAERGASASTPAALASGEGGAPSS